VAEYKVFLSFLPVIQAPFPIKFDRTRFFLNIVSNRIYLEKFIIHKKSSLSYCRWYETGVVQACTGRMDYCFCSERNFLIFMLFRAVWGVNSTMKIWYRGLHEMIRIHTSAVLAALLVFLFFLGQASGTGTDNSSLTVENLTSQPVQFIKNVGQSPDIIRYQAKSQGFSFDFTNTGMLVSGLPVKDSTVNESEIKPLEVTLEGAHASGIEPLDELPGYANFLVGRNESEFMTHVPWYGSIRYDGVLPGINLTYSGAKGTLKREYEVSPGADPLAIRLRYAGAENISISSDGSLLVSTLFGNLTEAAPVTYQIDNGVRTEVPSKYILLEDGLVGFSIGEYNRSIPLVIDPYLEYSTFLGGDLEDYGWAIAMDSSGSAYVTGTTSSWNFTLVNPINVNAPITYNGTYWHYSRDAFVTKINQTTGNNASIEFSTFLGGEYSDFGQGIAVDSLKNMYVTGYTYSDDFPVLLPVQNGGRLHGMADAFVTKIRADGANLWYSSYLGGNFDDKANGITVDSLGAAYLTGSTVGNSPMKQPEQNFPTTSGAYQTAPNTNAVMGDAFASKISPTGNSLEYSTYISGDNQDVGNGITVDGMGSVYVVGTTSSSNLLPSGVPGYQKTLKGSQDAFLFKMTFAAGSPPAYATYLGGSTGYDYGEAVAVDSAHSAYVTGATASTDFPVTTYAKQKTKGWQYDFFDKDAYVTKFSTDGASLLYSTYLGGSSEEWGYGIAVDSLGRAYVTGYTKSESFPKYDSIKSVTYSGDQDGFLTCVNADGSNWVYSTVFGGSQAEVSHGVAVSADGNTTLLTGWTSSPSIFNLVSGTSCTNDCFPVLRFINQATYPPGLNWYYGGNLSGVGDTTTFDAFVMKFGRSSLLPLFSANLTCGAIPLTVNFTDLSGSSANIVQRIWNFGDGTYNTTGSVAQNVVHTYTTYGTFPVTLTLYSYSGSAISDPITITACNPYLTANYSVLGFNSSVDPIYVPWKTPITFAGNANFTPSSWDWNFDDSLANVTGQNQVRQFTTQRNYNVTLTARGGCCGNVSIARNITAVAPPLADFTNATQRLNICPGDSVTFTDMSYNSSLYGPPSAWLWDFGDGHTSTAQNPTNIYLHSGTYTVSLIVTNVAGTSLPAVKTGFVTVKGEIDAGFDADVKTGLAPLTVNFTDRSTGLPTAWEWDFGDGTAHAFTQNATHTYTSTGRFDVNLTIWDSCGAVSFSDYANLSDYITVNGNMSPVINFSYVLAGPYTDKKINGTNPLWVYFLGNTSTGFLIDEFWWDYGDGNVTPHQTRQAGWPADNTWVNTSHRYSTVGDFTPVLQVINNTWAGTSTTGYQYEKYVGVYNQLIANFLVSPSSGVAGQTFQFTDLSLGSPSTWNYTFGDGNTSTDQNPRHAYTSAFDYHIWLNVTNKYGALNTTDVRILHVGPSSNVTTIRYVPTDLQMVTGMNSARKVQVFMDPADYGLTSFTIKYDLDNTTSSNFYAVAERPSWIDADKWNTFIEPAGRAQYLTVSGWSTTGMPPGSRNVSLGNITLIGTSSGNNIMRLNSSSIAQYGASFMTLLSSPLGIHVYEIGPLPGFTSSPQDIRPAGLNDGLLDDFDGNGAVNSADVRVFFEAYSNGALSSFPIPPFDYNLNGRIDTDDIVKFFQAYSTW
jgi:PKD repeat protein